MTSINFSDVVIVESITSSPPILKTLFLKSTGKPYSLVMSTPRIATFTMSATRTCWSNSSRPSRRCYYNFPNTFTERPIPVLKLQEHQIDWRFFTTLGRTMETVAPFSTVIEVGLSWTNLVTINRPLFFWSVEITYCLGASFLQNRNAQMCIRDRYYHCFIS